MANKNLRTRISLKRDIESNLISLNPVLLKGEIYFVDTSEGLKVKVGDGSKTFKQLDYTDLLIRGYYLSGRFYTDSTYTVQITPSISKLYLDINGDKITRKCLYYWNGNKYIATNGEDIATDTVAGIMKLYNESGNNIDGTMTQRSITEGIDNIVFAIDEEDEECLILDKPW